MQSVTTIQGLRAIAAWLVVYHHYMQYFYNFNYSSSLGAFFSHYGILGVDIFFIISGFIMFYSLTVNMRTARQFFLGRLRRIVPVYWFYTLLTLLIIYAYFPSGGYPWTYASLLQSLLFIPHQNPAGLGIYPLLLVGWTLNVEMFFYSILTLYLLILKRYQFMATALTLIMLSLGWQEQWLFSWLLGNSRLIEFALGLGFGYVYCKTGFFNALPTPLAVIAAVLLGYITYRTPTAYALHIYASLLIVCALTFEKHLTAGRKRYAYVVKLGDISYSTYLSHTLILFVMQHYRAYLPEPINLVLITAGIVLVSALSYSAIEQGKYFTASKVYKTT